MTPDELDSLIGVRLHKIAETHDGPAYPVILDGRPLRMAGMATFSRGIAPPGLISFEASLSILDDRSGNTRGPDSFDSDFMDLMLRGSSLVAIDSAEPGYDIYNYFMQEVARGRKLLVIQTTEEHHSRWREFLCERWEGDSIAEIWPVKNDPERILRADITRFDPDRKKPQ